MATTESTRCDAAEISTTAFVISTRLRALCCACLSVCGSALQLPGPLHLQAMWASLRMPLLAGRGLEWRWCLKAPLPHCFSALRVCHQSLARLLTVLGLSHFLRICDNSQLATTWRCSCETSLHLATTPELTLLQLAHDVHCLPLTLPHPQARSIWDILSMSTLKILTIPDKALMRYRSPFQQPAHSALRPLRSISHRTASHTSRNHTMSGRIPAIGCIKLCATIGVIDETMASLNSNGRYISECQCNLKPATLASSKETQREACKCYSQHIWAKQA